MNRAIHIAAILLSLLLSIRFASGQAEAPVFPGAQYPVGSNPYSVAIGDLNGDGNRDLVTANYSVSYGLNNISVLLGNGKGGFGGATNITLASGSRPSSIAIGDLNGDGRPDLATANSGSNKVSVLLGNGQGGFGSATNFAVGTSPSSVAIGDLNGDGKQDLVTANGGSSNVSVLLGNGQGSFGLAINYAVGIGPRSVAIGDFNRDGRPDLVTANYYSDNVSVLLGNGQGSFGNATNFMVYFDSELDSVVIGDLNGDGRLDLAMTNRGSFNVFVLLGNGQGGFGSSTKFGVGRHPYSVAVGDLNGDGRLDLAVANNGSKNVSVLLGNGHGEFDHLTNFTGPLTPNSVAIGDLSGDGKPDLVTADIGGPRVTVLLGNGQGGFGPATGFAVGMPVYSVAIGDLNGDESSDLVSASRYYNIVSVLLGNGQGGFGPATDFTIGNYPNSVAIGDLNGDGRLDLVTANGTTNNVSVLLGNGQGGFGLATNFGAGTNPNSVAIGDLNGDGKLDLATANSGSTNVSVLLGNGQGGFGIATNFIVGNGPKSVAIGDLNGDGRLDLAVANSSNVSVLLGDGQGGFGIATNFAVGTYTQPASVVISDLNGDGKPDLVTANGSNDNVSVLLGNGQGGFGLATNFSALYYESGITSSAAVGDLNGDGRPDVVTTQQSAHAGALTVLLNELKGVRVVLGSNSIPMANVYVEAVDPNSDYLPVDSTWTLSDGSFRFHSIPDGSWSIRASVPNPAGVGSIDITNYPNNNPTQTWSFCDGKPSQKIPDIRFPSPVALQGGWNGDQTTWITFLNYLCADPAVNSDKKENKVPAFLCYPFYGYGNDASSVEDHDANAKLLAGFIEGISLAPWISANDRPNTEFAILAHSMGGLITRAMVSPSPIPQLQTKVSRIVNLDTPHGGSVWGDIPFYTHHALGEPQLNGYREFDCGDTWVKGWNAEHVEMPNSGRNWLLYKGLGNDFFVNIVYPDESAFGWGRLYSLSPSWGPDNLCLERWVQGNELTVQDNHAGIHENLDRARESALFFVSGSVSGVMPPSMPQRIVLPSDPTEGLGSLSGPLVANAGSSTTQQLRFDSNATVYGRIIRSGATAQYSLKDSAGTPLTLTNFATDSISSTDSFDSFEIVAPPTGIINLRLTAGSSDAQLGYAFYFGNGRKLVATIAAVSMNAGSSTQLQAYLADSNGNIILGGSSSSFSATIRLPGGTSQSLTLFDDGAHGDGGANDGVFGDSIGGSSTSVMGRYSVDVYGMKDFGTYSIERTATTGFVVNPTGAVFSGGMTESTVDLDGNGLYDSLRFSQAISLTSNGSYKLMADLKDSLGNLFDILSASFDNTQGSGSTTMQLSISGADLTRHGVAGPWTLSNIRLVKTDAGSLPIMTAPDHVTLSYVLSAFDWPLPPRISGLTPSQGLPAGGEQVVLVGSNLLGTASVLVDGRPVTFVVQDDQSLLVTIPRMRKVLPAVPQIPGQPGTGASPYPIYVDVKVTTPWGHDFVPHAFAYTR